MIEEWMVIPIIAILAWVATSWIRARHGYSRFGGGRRNAEISAEIKELKETIGARDATISRLEERVRVLERIVTDKSARLNEEISRLTA